MKSIKITLQIISTVFFLQLIYQNLHAMEVGEKTQTSREINNELQMSPEPLNTHELPATDNQISEIIAEKLNAAIERLLDPANPNPITETTTFKETVERLQGLLCNAQFYTEHLYKGEGKFKIGNKHIELFQDSHQEWQTLTDINQHYFYSWFDNAVDLVCNSNPHIQKLILLASQQLASITQESKEHYTKLINSLPTTLSYRIKELFTWNDDSFEITPQECKYDNKITAILLKKNKLIIAFNNKTIQIWDLRPIPENNPEPTTLASELNSKITALAKRHQYIASGLMTGTIELWNLTTKKQMWMKTIFNKGAARSLVFLNNNYLASLTHVNDNKIQIWNIAKGLLEKELLEHDAPIESMVLLHNGQLASSTKHIIKIWDTTSFECIATLDATPFGDKDFNIDCLLALEDKLISGSLYNIILWDYMQQIPPRVFQKKEKFIKKLVPLDKNLIMSSSGFLSNKLLIWDIRTGICLKKFKNNDRVEFIAKLDHSMYPNQCKVITGAQGKTLQMWNLPTFKKVLATRIEKNKRL